MRKALIRQSDGLVVNMIEWLPDSSWPVPAGHYLIDGSTGNPGDTWDGVKFIPQVVPIPEPPLSTHISTLQAVDPNKARPAKVKRTWQGIDYFYDCLVTQTVKDEFVAGKIKIGDYVLVHMDDIGEQVVTGKVFKSW